MICRLDETLKVMNNESKSQSPGYSDRKGGKQNLRELVNPSIMQPAPEVSSSVVLTW